MGCRDRMEGYRLAVPKLKMQKKRFFDLVNSGAPTSYLYARFPGKTPWRRVGEIVAADGDFSEAVQAQWILIMRWTYHLHKKFRFFLVKETPIEFGYTDENANMVVYSRGPFAEAVDAGEVQEKLRRNGWLPGWKPRQWIPCVRQIRETQFESKKDHHLTKPWLCLKQRNREVSALSWWEIQKLPKKKFNHWQAKKRGRVIGVGHSTPWKGWMKNTHRF